MTKLKIPPPMPYMEKARASGLMTEKNRELFLMVAEMLKRPLSVEQKRAQIAKGSPEVVRYDDPKGR